MWFDENELRGGDSWDAKIKTQIRDCALFLPVISANTQARLEGYFRLEWKLAEDRSHRMAKSKPFRLRLRIRPGPESRGAKTSISQRRVWRSKRRNRRRSGEWTRTAFLPELFAW